MRIRNLNRAAATGSIEWAFWIAAIVFLTLTDPDAAPVVEFCAWKWFGFSGCPGCGMGHALAYILDGRLLDGIGAHPLSPFAAATIVARVESVWPRGIRIDLSR